MGYYMPKRLLELSTDGGERIFRLVSGDEVEVDRKKPYVTLSHCWGPAPAHEKLRLIRSSEDTLRAGYLVGRLPRTFRDAFEVLARLGVRHIWIDRLCIVQDSVEDWREAAATMHDIYRHGYLNIAALGSPDDEGGLFFDRDPASVAPALIDLSREWPDRKDDGPFIFRFEGEEETWRYHFEGQPLLGRAWVVQERVLAPRNLYFGTHQIFWECWGRTHCETNPRKDLLGRHMTPSAKGSGGGGGVTSAPARHGWKDLISGLDARIRTHWGSMVEMYCRCGLSYASDKLVALSGMAKDWATVGRDDDDGDGGDLYVVGLWRREMPANLMWWVEGRVTRPASYRAPSWSWACLDGKIHLEPPLPRPVKSHQPLVEVIGAGVVPKGLDPTGEVEHGLITLKGPLLYANVKPLSPGNKRVFDLDAIHNPFTMEAIDPDELGDESKSFQVDVAGEYCSEAYVLLFYATANTTFNYLTMQGLALVPVDETRSFYRRIGHASIQTYSWEDYNGQEHLADVLSKIPIGTVNVV